MKQVTYQIQGAVPSPEAHAATEACANVAGVIRTQLEGRENENTRLTLILTHEPTEADEKAFVEAWAERGYTLLLDTRTVRDVEPPPHYTPEQKGRRITLGSAVAAMVTAVIITVLITFSITVNYLRKDTPPTADLGGGNNELTVFDHMAVLDRLFRDVGVTELDENFETLILKSYVAATGDTYAEYFTEEELKALTEEQNGEMCGVGLSVVNGILTSGGAEYQAIVVSNVYKDSPAERAGVLPGDYIMYVGIGEERVLVHDIGYTEALNRMSGEEGTTCSFVVWRFNSETEGYDEVEISAVREKLTTRSVTGRVYSLDSTVGIVKITGFDNTTAAQFTETVEELKVAGCTSFVLDLRGNPGGLLSSVEDVLTYFLAEGDVMISTKDSRQNETVTKLTVTEDGRVSTGSGTLTAADVGKYRDLDFTVLVNGYSASAAELFTANMRDYGLATVVGTKTFGKGSMQSTIRLSAYGYPGALKLTTAYYYPPSGEGYHDKGITPDVVVDLPEELKQININLLTDGQDNQLAEAVKALKPAA